ncbi:VWA domain-containing protein [Paenibacillus pinisoli]|uniref:non-specific serine/threonine protein kinase n=2 Tax=Paenibacillus pinisoli TaxID=1276110 RepID=A0A3A6PE64_9BACL|nr:VWA domain-containing protein [Paenibacillus pinisoli]
MMQQNDVIGGRYRVESLLAKGGMGCVYLVQDTKLNNKVWVVKEMAHMEHDNSFAEEARLLTSLTHPSIPKITDYFEPNEDGYCYLVMEYIKGVTLQQHFEGQGFQLPFQVIISYASQLCEVLDYLHQQEHPIVFRDLKPSNLMIDEYGRLKLIDFGIARKYDESKLSDTVQMGTIAFAAPEQFENRQTDPRTDIYAVGAILYYLASRGHYYFRNTMPLAQALASYPEEFRHMVQRLLETDPNQRYQSIRDIAAVLQKLQGDGAVSMPESELAKTMMIQSSAAAAPRSAVAAPVHEQATTHLYKQQTGFSSRKMHTVQATQSHPALIIYLLDVSGSMTLMNGSRRRLDIVTDSLYVALKQMVFRSTKGSRISPRYRVAVLAYSEDIHDVFGGIKRIDELMNTGMLPTLKTQRFTDTAQAFLYAEQLLKAELPHIQDGPAPLICHMTDGIYTGEDPEPIARRLMEMTVKDGNVLVENIFISDDVLSSEVDQPKRWPGVQDNTEFRDDYGRKLMRMSSPIPESYRQMMREANFNLADGSYLMFPGTNPELVSLGFQMSAATPIH